MEDDVQTALRNSSTRLDFIENQLSAAKMYFSLGAILVIGIILLNRDNHGKRSPTKRARLQ